MKCPNCGKESSPNDKHCIYCGKSFETHNYCRKCGAKLFENQKFCNKCGAEVKFPDENSSKGLISGLGGLLNGRNFVLAIGLVVLILMAAYFSGAFQSETHISGKGFSATFPKGYSMIEDKYMIAGANTVPLYMIYDDKGTNVLNISSSPQRFTGFNKSSDIEEYMGFFGFEDIEKIKLGEAEGYKARDMYPAWKGRNTAYVMLEGSKYAYRIEYLNEGNLSLLENASFSDYVALTHITELDEGRMYNGINSVELEGDRFTLKAPDGWSIAECEIDNNTRYDVLNERGTIRLTIVDFDGEEFVYNESDVKEVFEYFIIEYWNASDVRSYTIGGIDGLCIVNSNHDYGIVAVKGWHGYVIMYSDDESLGVANTIRFK